MHVTERELDFIDEPLLPEQFLTPAYGSRRLWTGERRLLLGVLEEAVRSFFQYRSARGRRGKQLFREVQEWLWSKDRHWLYSFENICMHLRLNPDYLRRGLQRWQQTSARGKSSTAARSNGTIPRARISLRMESGPGIRNANRFPQLGSSTKKAESLTQRGR